MLSTKSKFRVVVEEVRLGWGRGLSLCALVLSSYHSLAVCSEDQEAP